MIWRAQSSLPAGRAPTMVEHRRRRARSDGVPAPGRRGSAGSLRTRTHMRMRSSLQTAFDLAWLQSRYATLSARQPLGALLERRRQKKLLSRHPHLRDACKQVCTLSIDFGHARSQRCQRFRPRLDSMPNIAFVNQMSVGLYLHVRVLRRTKQFFPELSKV